MQLGVPLATVAQVAVAGYLAVGLPFAWFVQRRDSGQRMAAQQPERLSFYERSMRHHALLAGIALGVAGLAGWPLMRLGIRLPGHSLAPPETAAALCGLAAALAFRLLWHRPRSAATSALLPRTPEERRAFAAVAIIAGGAEELLYRGFLMLFLVDAGGLSWQQAALLSAATFGLGHAYQGARALLGSSAAGLALAECYVLTGSLLVPVLAHQVVDLLQVRLSRTARGRLEVQALQQALEPVAVVENVRGSR